MNLFKLVGTKLLWLTAAALLGTGPPVTVFGADRIVLVEDFAATWCAPCAYSTPALDQLLDDYPEDMVALTLHWSGGLPEYEFAIPWGDNSGARSRFYNLWAIPTTIFDGVTRQEGAHETVQANYDAYETMLLSRLDVPTDVTIEVSAVESAHQIHPSLQTFDVTTTVGIEPGGQAKSLQVYLVQARDNWPSSPSYWRNTLLRTFMTGVDVVLEPGETREFTQSFSTSVNSTITDDMKMIAWAQSPVDKEVFNATQFSFFEPTPLAGDFNDDGILDVMDIDALVTAILAVSNGSDVDLALDLTSDGFVDINDRDKWLRDAANANGFGSPYLLGDVNLDGIVNAQDLNSLGQHWLTSPNAWGLGDFNADGIVDASDLNKIGQNWLASIPMAATPSAAVPEPAAMILFTIGLSGLICQRHYSR